MDVATGISLLAAVMAGLTGLACGRRVALGVAALMAVEYRMAASGLLRQWDQRPPWLMLMVLAALAGAVWLAQSGRLDRVPLAALIGAQAFRLPLELTMHRAYAEGIMPVQMSYSGYNFDILTGATAIVVSLAAWRGVAPRWLIVGWNLVGSILLAVIVGIAVASTPLFAAFGQDRLNTWVADPPYMWLPGVLVPAALLGHLAVWRRLLATATSSPSPRLA